MHLLCASVIIDAVEKGKATPILMFWIHDDFNRAMVQIDAWKNPELLQKRQVFAVKHREMPFMI